MHLESKSVFSPKVLAYSAICIALAVVLSNIKLFQLPYGGSSTAFSMLFVSVIGYIFGLKAGLVAAVSYGLLQLFIDPYVIHPVQLLFDYVFAFGALGLSGLFSESRNGLTKGFLLGAMLRLVISTISGMVFFAEFAGEQPVFWYSVTYNGSYILPEIFVTLILINIGPFKNALAAVKEKALA